MKSDGPNIKNRNNSNVRIALKILPTCCCSVFFKYFIAYFRRSYKTEKGKLQKYLQLNITPL